METAGARATRRPTAQRRSRLTSGGYRMYGKWVLGPRAFWPRVPIIYIFPFLWCRGCGVSLVSRV